MKFAKLYEQTRADHCAATMATRELAVSVRAMDEDKRSAEFVASTETPVDMGFGREVLRIGGMNLARFVTNSVVLNAHRRGGIEDIVGNATVSKQGRELVANVTFSQATEAGRTAWALVQEGSLRAVSIGYRVQNYRELMEGEEDGEGDARVEGPAVVATKSELLEISVVPIPADPNALKRAYALAHKEAPVAEPETREQPPAPAPVAPAPEPVDADLAREIEARKAHVLAFTPADLRGYVEDLFLEQPEISPEDARKALVAKRQEQRKPVGTPAAPEIKTTKPAAESRQADSPNPEAASPEDLYRALTGH